MAYKEFEDDDIIPFGKHKGTRMIELPINYLIWALDMADEGTLKRYAKRNEQWIRAEAASGKRNRPVRVPRESGVDRNPPEPIPPKPPNLMTATEFICRELNLELDSVDVDDPAMGMSVSQIARLAERYKNYFNGTPNLKPLPKLDKNKGEKVGGWSSDPVPTGGWKYGDSEDDMPF